MLVNIVFFNICCFIVLDMNSVSKVCLSASKCFQCHSPAPHCTLLIDTSTLLSDTRKHPDDNSDDDIASVSPHFISSVSNTHQQSSEYDSTGVQDDSLPQVGRKRRRMEHAHHLTSAAAPTSCKDTFHQSDQIPTKRLRCHDEQPYLTDILYKRQSEPSADKNMTGDVDAEHYLPTVPGYHSDLNYISVKTMESLLNKSQEWDELNLILVDCRYPYEFNGGHIQGAVNLYTKEDIHHEFIDSSSSHRNERTIIVFHCEFSSERGPKMCRFLREQDRAAHSDCYPKLYYPEIYVLHGGYKAFYEESGTEQCQPQSYRPMLHQHYHAQLKQYRKKTKMWGRHKSWHGKELGGLVSNRKLDFHEV